MVTSIAHLAVLSVILLAAAGAGVLVVRVLRLQHVLSAGVLDRYVLVSTLGLGILSYGTLGLGLLGLLYVPILWLWLGAMLVGGSIVARAIGWWPSDWAQAARRLAGRVSWRRLGWIERALVIFLLLMVGLNLVGALAPPLGPDDLTYHFAMPKRYVNAHAICFIPDKYYSNLPYTMEMLWTLGIGLKSGEVAQLLNWFNSLLALGWIAALTRRVGLDRRHALLAGALFYAITTVSDQAKSGSSELGGTIFMLACLYLLLQWLERPRHRLLVLAGMFGGWYAGTKLFNPGALMLISAWVLMMALRRFRRLRTALAVTALFCLVWGGVVGVWYIKTWRMTGNPVYPFLWSTLGGPPIRTEAASFSPEVADLGRGLLASVRQVPSSWWDLLMEGIRVKGYVGPVFVAFVPVVLLGLRRYSPALRRLVGLTLLLALFWTVYHYYTRAALPFFAALSVPIAEAIFRFAQRGRVAAALSVFTVAVWLPISMGALIEDVAPTVPVVVGIQSRDDYLLRRGPDVFKFTSYDAFLYMNRHLPSDARVLLSDTRGYYLDRPHVHAREFVQSMADPDRVYDPNLVVEELTRLGITHVALIDIDSPSSRLRQALEKSGQLDCLFQGQTMTVCKLVDASSTARREAQ